VAPDRVLCLCGHYGHVRTNMAFGIWHLAPGILHVLRLALGPPAAKGAPTPVNPAPTYIARDVGSCRILTAVTQRRSFGHACQSRVQPCEAGRRLRGGFVIGTFQSLKMKMRPANHPQIAHPHSPSHL
jgi:hypothetical protein